MTDKTIKGHCPTCGPNRNAVIVAEHARTTEDEKAPVWVSTEYFILRCSGCDEIYFRQDSRCSEDYDMVENVHTGEIEQTVASKITYWPAPNKRSNPNWISWVWAVDRKLDELFTETYTALNNDAPILAAIGVRTILDHVSETLGVDPASPFCEKLEALQSSGKIGADEKETLSILTDAGGAAAHRGWKPSDEQLNMLVTIIESFVYRTVILQSEAEKLKAAIPPKPKRR